MYEGIITKLVRNIKLRRLKTRIRKQKEREKGMLWLRSNKAPSLGKIIDGVKALNKPTTTWGDVAQLLKDSQYSGRHHDKLELPFFKKLWNKKEIDIERLIDILGVTSAWFSDAWFPPTWNHIPLKYAEIKERKCYKCKDDLYWFMEHLRFDCIKCNTHLRKEYDKNLKKLENVNINQNKN